MVEETPVGLKVALFINDKWVADGEGSNRTKAEKSSAKIGIAKFLQGEL